MNDTAENWLPALSSGGRAGILHHIDGDIPFREREEGEDTYKLYSEDKRLFDRVLEYAR
jgi:hypothetical protein